MSLVHPGSRGPFRHRGSSEHLTAALQSSSRIQGGLEAPSAGLQRTRSSVVLLALLKDRMNRPAGQDQWQRWESHEV